MASKRALGPTESPAQCVSHAVKQTTYLYQVPRLRVSGAVLFPNPLPQYAVMACPGSTLPFIVFDHFLLYNVAELHLYSLQYVFY
jgi:hypothetical protein